MTYCLTIQHEAGIVFASDSRTNAGVDYVTRYSKMYVFDPAPDRLFVLLSAGNLASTQEVVSRLKADIAATDERTSLTTCATLFEAADYIGQTSLFVQERHRPALVASGVSGETSFLLGGQIGAGAHGVYLVYPQGNAIESSPETPFLQIGEVKYGKPVLDRFARHVESLENAARLALVSLDATMQSNVSVGPPFEFGIYERDSFTLARRFSIRPESAYFREYREVWERNLGRAFRELPRFDWESTQDEGSA